MWDFEFRANARVLKDRVSDVLLGVHPNVACVGTYVENNKHCVKIGLTVPLTEEIRLEISKQLKEARVVVRDLTDNVFCTSGHIYADELDKITPTVQPKLCDGKITPFKRNLPESKQ